MRNYIKRSVQARSRSFQHHWSNVVFIYAWPHLKQSLFRNLAGNFFFVKSGILGFGIRVQLKESGIPLTIGTQDPSSTEKDSGLKSGIQIMKSRIPDCLGLTYIGRYVIIPSLLYQELLPLLTMAPTWRYGCLSSSFDFGHHDPLRLFSRPWDGRKSTYGEYQDEP